MQTEPEVLTNHTEVIFSTSIERVVSGRNAALAHIKALIHQLDEISVLTNSIEGGTAKEWAMRQGLDYNSWLTDKVDMAIQAITRNIDRSLWRDLMLNSGMISLMDAQARDEWHKNLDEGDLPEISEENILATFEQLHHSQGEVFERGVINVFKGLSWDYKANSPCSFGKKIIINNLVTHNRWDFSLKWGWRRDQLTHLERMLFLLDGKPIPDNRGDVTTRLMEHIRHHPSVQSYEDDFFSILYFQKRTAHLTFKNPELIEKMTDIIAKHSP